LETETLQIVDMTKEYAGIISGWKYGGAYSIYDESEENIDGFMNGAHFACTDASGELIGYFCFGEDARIPTVEENVYDDNFIDIGLGLKPDLCGRSLGLTFLKKGLQHARDIYGATSFRLTVAAFNERAIKVYERAGFCTEREVTHLQSNQKFLIMKHE